MSSSTPSTLIIPDVHGREFWRRAVAERKAADSVIFLGDYLDPYENECIYWNDAYRGFLDIVALKRECPEKVTLLLGNHDLHYLFPALRGSRYNKLAANKIRKTFEDNMGCFQMAAECEVAQRKYLFTHAGVHKIWLKKHEDLFGQVDQVSADTFNKLMFKKEFVKALGKISPWRGGKAKAGSMIWADVNEYESSDTRIPDMIQVFGHTQMDEPKVINDSMYCLDCRRAFVLRDSGLIEQC